MFSLTGAINMGGVSDRIHSKPVKEEEEPLGPVNVFNTFFNSSGIEARPITRSATRLKVQS